MWETAKKRGGKDVVSRQQNCYWRGTKESSSPDNCQAGRPGWLAMGGGEVKAVAQSTCNASQSYGSRFQKICKPCAACSDSLAGRRQPMVEMAVVDVGAVAAGQ